LFGRVPRYTDNIDGLYSVKTHTKILIFLDLHTDFKYNISADNKMLNTDNKMLIFAV